MASHKDNAKIQKKMNNATDAIKKIINDLKVELLDEFDRNFERGAFFTKKWDAKYTGEASNLIKSGKLRRSILATSTEGSLSFTSSEVYAAIHNYGGDITVTDKMKRFFWAKYYEAGGGSVTTATGKQSKSKGAVKANKIAEAYKGLALKPVGSKIKIPRRMFIGWSPEVKKIVTDTIKQNMKEEIIVSIKNAAK